MSEPGRSPVLEQVFGLKRDRFVVVYPHHRGEGHDVWVYAWDGKVVKSHEGGQPAGPIGLGRCLSLRFWGQQTQNGPWDLWQEVGDLDQPTLQALRKLLQDHLPKTVKA